MFLFQFQQIQMLMNFRILLYDCNSLNLFMSKANPFPVVEWDASAQICAIVHSHIQDGISRGFQNLKHTINTRNH